ncbi:lysophospholipid acyltransferase family protein [Dasania sp. GY-MA-18]|uniref:Lysophospholipid acyltransferase family protein n=1 Tax=Dasania phycosphaerae TaxID=2950436 RepID=A0A9J6RJL0_9GAMM|nr:MULTISPECIES: lysophospholipid acyltransferase family protein [Dasania]MCR8921996.1 lysophospholipid acyltransferase family protein [Dasania sp. GY-MA-18]MCZ0864424.1 lysophospholipid acyltransferase family protein [Dasania phycosphaerae]MCZ0868152.1 lysophospholipid acyltransferase family protein [Dasania phycosphaerae]
MKSWLALTTIKSFALLPMPLLRVLGRWVGYGAWLSNGRSRQITEFNIALCYPQLSAAQQRHLAKQSVQQLGVLLLEMGPVWRWSPQRLMQHITEVSDLALLERAEQAGKGTVVVLPHLGCWELMGVFLAQRGAVTSLYQPPEDPGFDQMIYHARQRTGNTLVPTNTRGVKALLKALKAGETVVILPDQLPVEGSGEFADFYGQPTYTMTLVHNLIKRTGANLVGAVAERTGRSGYKISFVPAPADINASDSKLSLTALNRCVENCVQLCPEQYQWEYNRFKWLPNGQRRSYKN